ARPIWRPQAWRSWSAARRSTPRRVANNVRARLAPRPRRLPRSMRPGREPPERPRGGPMPYLRMRIELGLRTTRPAAPAPSRTSRSISGAPPPSRGDRSSVDVLGRDGDGVPVAGFSLPLAGRVGVAAASVPDGLGDGDGLGVAAISDPVGLGEGDGEGLGVAAIPVPVGVGDGLGEGVGCDSAHCSELARPPAQSSAAPGVAKSARMPPEVAVNGEVIVNAQGYVP